MTRLLSFAQMLRREDGQGTTEYALLLVLIAVAIIATVTALGLAISSKYQSARDCVATLTC